MVLLLTVSMVAVFAIMIATLLRFGLIAAMVASCLLPILGNFLFTFDFARWYAPGSLIILLLIGGLYVYGFVISLGGHRLFTDPFEN